MNEIIGKTFDEERALYGSRNVCVKDCLFDGPADGESAFKESRNVQVENTHFNLRYPFWHGKSITVRNSTVKGEYLAWYSDGITLENCKIIGTQPFCYCRNLKLINCEMIDTDLCFEKSDVEAVIISPVISIKNPLSGNIYVPEVGEIILDEEIYMGNVIIQGQQKMCVAV